MLLKKGSYPVTLPLWIPLGNLPIFYQQTNHIVH